MFQTVIDATAFADDRKAQALVPGTLDAAAKDERPGTSEASRWLDRSGTKNDFLMSLKLPPISRYMLQAGALIQATTLNATNSDLPGDIIALINNDVYDTVTGTMILIPATSKLYIRYSEDITYGQNRLQFSIPRILFPDGTSINLGGMAGTDEAGAAGVEGDVDRHIPELVASVGVSALLSIIGQAGQLFGGNETGQTNIGVIGTEGAGRETQSIGRDIAQKELSRKNTITLPPGSTVAVMLQKDVALPPYESFVYASD